MKKPFPLLPTVGPIRPEQIVGRDREITKLLRLLRSQSVSVEEMRRMGKTLLLQKLAYLCNNNGLPEEFERENFKAQYFSFQGKQNFGEVIDLLIHGLREFKAWYQIDLSRTYQLIRSIFSIPGIEVGHAKFTVNLPEYKRSWKEIFYTTLEDIASAQEKAGGKLILIFDELPIMLWEWYKEGKHDEAMEFLDMLRERRQALETKGLRFIYCGSIGIKVVLSTFRKDLKYTGEPTNEMEEFDLKPFSEEEADFLCNCFLLSGFESNPAEKVACLKLIYTLSNGLPFYISLMFNLIQVEFDYKVTPESIERSYKLILTDPRHHKVFKQLIERLEIYYSPEQKNQMIKVLNFLSKIDVPINEDLIYDGVEIDSKELLNEILYILLGDHYLKRDIETGKRIYSFKYQIFKEWWKINKA